MAEVSTDKKHEEFNKVVDATSNFLKTVFPHVSELVKNIKARSAESKNKK